MYKLNVTVTSAEIKSAGDLATPAPEYVGKTLDLIVQDNNFKFFGLESYATSGDEQVQLKLICFYCSDLFVGREGVWLIEQLTSGHLKRIVTINSLTNVRDILVLQ